MLCDRHQKWLSGYLYNVRVLVSYGSDKRGISHFGSLCVRTVLQEDLLDKPRDAKQTAVLEITFATSSFP